MRGQKCQVLQKLNSSLINHSTQAMERIILLVLTITSKKGHIPATVTTFFPLVSNSSVFGSLGRTKKRNIHLKGWNSLTYSQRIILRENKTNQSDAIKKVLFLDLGGVVGAFILCSLTELSTYLQTCVCILR